MKRDQLKGLLEPLLDTCKKAPWGNKKFYEQYLAQTYYYTFHSTRMLAYAASLTSSTQENYYRRSIKHISEENGHEKIALNDLRKTGGNIQNYPELPATKAFWQTQYYYINKNNVSLLGYILALEWFAVEAFPAVYQTVESLYGAQSSLFIKIHAEEDPHHVNECFEQIEALSEAEKQIVFENFEQSCRMFTLFIKEVEESVISIGYYERPDKKTLEGLL